MGAVDLIHARSQLAAGFVAPRSGDVAVAASGLERMRRLCDALGNPQRAYKTIHVAGSKGKGSTVAYAAAILTATGRRTGRYTSPHLMDWRERIAVDGVDLSESDFDRVLGYVDSTMVRLEADRPDDPPHNAFELLTAAAFVHFQEVGCEAAVIEVGIGGRFDSTNVVDSAVSVITSIEAEHLDMLGPTLSDVAWNKAGVMRPGCFCVSGTNSWIGHLFPEQAEVVMSVLYREARAIDAVVSFDGFGWYLDVHDEPDPTRETFNVRVAGLVLPGLVKPSSLPSQVLDAAMAIVAVVYLSYYDGLDLPSVDQINDGLAEGSLPGRFEVVDGAPVTVLDVAHTAESIAALGEGVRLRFPGRRVVALLGVLADKDADTIGQAVSGWSDAVVATTAPSPRSRPSAAVATAVRGHMVDVHDATDIDDGWSTAGDLAGERGVVVVTGSFALVAKVRRLLLNRG